MESSCFKPVSPRSEESVIQLRKWSIAKKVLWITHLESHSGCIKFRHTVPFTFRLAEHFALAPWNETSPDWDTLQLYKVKMCLVPSSMISTSCCHTEKKNSYAIPTNVTCVTISNSFLSPYRWWGEDFSLQLPLAMDIVFRDFHLKTRCLTIKQLNTIHGSHHFDVTSCS